MEEFNTDLEGIDFVESNRIECLQKSIIRINPSLVEQIMDIYGKTRDELALSLIAYVMTKNLNKQQLTKNDLDGFERDLEVL